MRLAKSNGAHLELDTAAMNGSDGAARLYVGNASNEAVKGFNFNENGIFSAQDLSTTKISLDTLFSHSNASLLNNGIIDDALNIDTSGIQLSDQHKPKIVYYGRTINMPDNCRLGIRNVYVLDANNYLVTIMGRNLATTDPNNIGIWMAFYIKGAGWAAWKTL